MKIQGAELRIITDSRGEETLSVEMSSKRQKVISSIPQGKSKGKKEAFWMEPQRAISIFDRLKKEILKRDFNNLQEFDDYLRQLDGTSDKRKLGGNLILVLSQAFARLLAAEQNKELWQFLEEEINRLAPKLFRKWRWRDKFQKRTSPLFLFNLVNGGKHALYGPKIQEYLVVPLLKNPNESLILGKFFFTKLKEYFWEKYRKQEFGDEGGLLIPETFYEKPLEIYERLRRDLHLEKKIAFSLDVAASTFYDFERRIYTLLPGRTITAEELEEIYQELDRRYHLLSVEDPFAEDDWVSFQKLTASWKGKTLIIGDDLTVSNPILIERAGKEKTISGVIIKPTQIGSVSETLQAIILAHRLHLKIIVSHRSGETEDDFIADLAWAARAWGLKAGAPQPPERMVKYKRVIDIYNHYSKTI